MNRIRRWSTRSATTPAMGDTTMAGTARATPSNPRRMGDSVRRYRSQTVPVSSIARPVRVVAQPTQKRRKLRRRSGPRPRWSVPGIIGAEGSYVVEYYGDA
jgi:hypothetical protein